MPRIVTNFWFDTEGEEAADFYCSIFPNSKIVRKTHYTESGPRDAGMVMTVDFELDGTPFTAINGGPEFKPDEAVSMLIECEDQDEIDHYWDKLSEGGREVQCGWLADRYGFAWQVVPKGMDDVFEDDDPARADRAMKAMLKMVKIDVAALKAAADSD